MITGQVLINKWKRMLLTTDVCIFLRGLSLVGSISCGLSRKGLSMEELLLNPSSDKRWRLTDIKDLPVVSGETRAPVSPSQSGQWCSPVTLSQSHTHTCLPQYLTPSSTHTCPPPGCWSAIGKCLLRVVLFNKVHLLWNCGHLCCFGSSFQPCQP